MLRLFGAKRLKVWSSVEGAHCVYDLLRSCAYMQVPLFQLSQLSLAYKYGYELAHISTKASKWALLIPIIACNVGRDSSDVVLAGHPEGPPKPDMRLPPHGQRP